MFLEYFDNLREKPKNVRKQYALFFTALITAFIVLIWLLTVLLGNFGRRTVDDGENAKLNSEQQEEQNITTLFNSSNSFIESDPKESNAAGSQYDWSKELEDFNTAPISQTGTSSDVMQENASTSINTSTSTNTSTSSGLVQ